MSVILALDDLRPDPGIDPTGPGITTTTFYRASSDTPDSPSAYLLQFEPGRVASPHYHVADEFQVMVGGKGKFGRREVSPYCVHFARAYTPYGPLLPDEKTGWAFLTLRTRYDPGAQFLIEALRQIPDRRPWQVIKKIAFPVAGSGVSSQDILEIKDDQGLFARSLTMGPDTQVAAPGPSGGDGQYVVVVKGSLVHENKERKALALVFLKPDENAFQIHAGPRGLEAIILNFPQVKPRIVEAMASSADCKFKKWRCELCTFAYDEAKGMPEEGVPAGTRWEDVPDTWCCPDCSANKSDFQMVET
jgi:rubredoxin